MSKQHFSRRRFLQIAGAGATTLALGRGPFQSLRAEAAGQLLPAGYLETSGAQIVPAGGGASVRLAGVNWYGFDCDTYCAGEYRR